MRIQTVTMTAFVLLCSSGTALCQEKYTIQLKELGVGMTSRVERRDSGSFKSSFSVDKSKETGKVEEQKIGKHLIFTQTILARPDPTKLPTKLLRVYEKAQVLAFGAPVQKELANLSYQGKSVLIEKKNDRYEFNIQGGEAVKEDPELESEFNGGSQQVQKKLFLPAGPVAQGQAWKIDPKSLLTSGKNDKLDVIKADGAAKLVKVYRKDGRLYGTIEAETHLEFRVKTLPGVEGESTSENKAVMKMTFDGCIDGSFADGQAIGTAEFSNTTAFKGNATEPGGRAVTSGSTKVEEIWRELPRK